MIPTDEESVIAAAARKVAGGHGPVGRESDVVG
jgi:hypothetical protein